MTATRVRRRPAPIPSPTRVPAEPIRLTPAQQAVAEHETGPALVFAAAGSGKTTTLVARIERLVRQGISPPGSILATSFNRDAASSIERSLRHKEIRGVRVQTLHAFSLSVIGEANRRKLIPGSKEGASPVGLDRRLLQQAVGEARNRRVDYARELNRLDEDGFLAYVARQKAGLAYPPLGELSMAAPVRAKIQRAQAPAENEWYLDLYAIYERIRRTRGNITFDDMAPTAWEALLTHPELLAAFEQRFRSILVDEFQDVSMAQAELIDLVSRKHRNLMVIGDDDQTIYEWRGAQPRFILNFEKRYGARVYFLEENFRCRASHVALANAVIERAEVRSPKRLGLTRGFGGETVLHRPAGAAEAGEALVKQIERGLRDGYTHRDAAVLVRLFAQTGPVESALLRAGIPYRLEGEQPFYKRPEVRALLDYVYLAQVENDLMQGGSIGDVERYRRAWRAIRNRPRRYMRRDLGEKICDWTIQKRTPICETLLSFAAQETGRPAEHLKTLAADLRWLAGQVTPTARAQRSAVGLLASLNERLGYTNHLREEGASEDLGRARAGAVEALITLSAAHGPLDRFLRYIERLMHSKRTPPNEGVLITTIFRAKGLEWPIVLLPDCVEGTIPCTHSEEPGEERRLFYVALTRARERLHLFAPADEPLSSYLLETDVEKLLEMVGSLKHSLELPPNRWRSQDATTVAQAGHRLGFYPYFAHWWPIGAGEKQAAADSIVKQVRLGRTEKRFWEALARGQTPPIPRAPVATPSRRRPARKQTAPEAATRTAPPQANRGAVQKQGAKKGRKRRTSSRRQTPVKGRFFLRTRRRGAGWLARLRSLFGRNSNLS